MTRRNIPEVQRSIPRIQGRHPAIQRTHLLSRRRGVRLLLSASPAGRRGVRSLRGRTATGSSGDGGARSGGAGRETGARRRARGSRGFAGCGAPLLSSPGNQPIPALFAVTSNAWSSTERNCSGGRWRGSGPSSCVCGGFSRDRRAPARPTAEWQQVVIEGSSPHVREFLRARPAGRRSLEGIPRQPAAMPEAR